MHSPQAGWTKRSRGIRSRSRDNGYAPLGGFHGEFDDAVMFFVGQGGGFTARAAGYDPIRPIRNLKFNEIAECTFVDPPILKGSDDGDR